MKMLTTTLLTCSMTAAGLLACQMQEAHNDRAKPEGSQGNAKAHDWRAAEQGILENHVQLTFSDRFIKAGESYFSPDNSKIIFQAVEKPPAGQTADDFYAMFVADVVRDARSGNIKSIEKIKRLSPKGSANTCGWFHPTDANVVLFGSTIEAPVAENRPAMKGGADDRYKWSFPKNMRVVRCALDKADGTAATITPVGGYGDWYQAEDSLSPDGRQLLFCSRESGEGDLFVFDLKTKKKTRIVQADGYDGGPFFSPDGKRICYRSDRHNDDLLQLFVAELEFNDGGEIVGIAREYQLTDEACVNWCPFWTPDGRRVVYSSSVLGERNFEIFMCDADPGDLKGSNGTIRYGTAKRRLTHFEPFDSVAGSDVLPALSSDGKWMIWSSRRSDDNSVQLWAAKLVLNPDASWKPQPDKAPAPARHAPVEDVVINDPDTGRIFLYNPETQGIREYDMKTHTVSEITDPLLIEHVKQLYEEQEAK